jgi:DNA-binding transcriptional ArsR family regulator
MVNKIKMMKEMQPPQLEPERELHVTEIETLKILSDALRSRILDLLRAEPLTVKQLAAMLKLAPKKLYYHVNLMEQHGLIRIVSTRLVSGIVEKTYRATAYLFLFEDEVFTVASTAGETSLPPGLALLFETTKIQLDQSVENGLVDLAEGAPTNRRLLFGWDMTRMTPEQAEAFYARLTALLDEFRAMGENRANANAPAYRLFCALFPVRRYPEASSEQGARGEES